MNQATALTKLLMRLGSVIGSLLFLVSGYLLAAKHPNGYLLLIVAAVIILVVHFRRLPCLIDAPLLKEPPNWFEPIVLTVAALVGFFSTMSYLSSKSGFHYDTAEHGLAIVQHLTILKEADYHFWMYILRDPHDSLVALIIHTFGLGLFQFRIVGAISCLLVLPIAYLAVRELFNRTIAAIATLLIAGSLWLFVLSKLGHWAVPVPLIGTLTMYFFLLMVKKDRGHRFGIPLLLAILLGFNIYEAYRLILPSLGCCLLYMLIIKKQQRTKALIIGGTLLVAVAIQAFLIDPQLWNRLGGSGLFAQHHQERFAEYVQTFFGKLFTGTYDIELSTSQGGLDHFLIIGLILAGFFICLANCADQRVLFLLFWIIPPALFALVFEGQWRRATAMLAAFYALAAFPIADLIHFLGTHNAANPNRRRLAFALPTLVAVSLMIFNVSRFPGIHNNRSGGYYMPPDRLAVVDYCVQFAHDRPFYIFADAEEPLWNFFNKLAGGSETFFALGKNILVELLGHGDLITSVIESADQNESQETSFVVENISENQLALTKLKSLLTSSPDTVKLKPIPGSNETFSLFVLGAPLTSQK